jgi:hypothetical protein
MSEQLFGKAAAYRKRVYGGKGMASRRISDLQRRLERNKLRVLGVFGKFQPPDWDKSVYEKPAVWTARDLLAHFVSAEKELLVLAQNLAAGGKGAPEGFDYNGFNRTEQEKYRSTKPEELIGMFAESRDKTTAWAAGLTDGQLDNKGRHPAMGEVTLEAVLEAVCGHVLLHLRELNHSV